jgi:pSer/pThr/pTyr-binding forkhead associated (FHA) protein
MIRCKLCGKEEYHGKIFCSDCGSQLVFTSDLKVDTLINPSPIGGLELDISRTIPKKLLEEKEFLLYYPDGDEVLDLPEQNEFTIGRLVEGQVIAPDVDLNKYGGYDLGVSRLHATIRINPNNKIHLIDLGSANGSKVNGYTVPANSEVPLNHGDTIILGKFPLRVILPGEMK